MTDEPRARVYTNQDGGPGAVAVFCPACGREHDFDVDRWAWNGDLVRPTFTPSMKITTGPYPDGSRRAGRVEVCHSFVTDGKIAYCGDCTHDKAGQTLDLPPFAAASEAADAAMYARLGMSESSL